MCVICSGIIVQKQGLVPLIELLSPTLGEKLQEQVPCTCALRLCGAAATNCACENV